VSTNESTKEADMKSAIRLCACVTAITLGSCHTGGTAAPQPGALPANASVTVFPVLLGGTPSAEVANVVGILLERGGLQQVELAAAAFTPEHGLDCAAQAAAFGRFVQQREMNTDFALFAAILGTPGKGVEGVRSAIVDRQGRVVWSDEQRQGSPAFDRAKPGEPMACVMLLGEQLQQPLQLGDPMRAGAPASKLEQRMSQQAGVPPKAEFEAMAQRLTALRRAGKPTIRVYPPRVGTDWSSAGAAAIAAALEQAGVAVATAVSEPFRFTAQPSMNEQQMLWSAARSIQQAVRAAPPQTDYLLFADFLMQADNKAGAVHTFLLAPTGEFVVVDYQNSHHEDFQRVAPTSPADCSRLAAIRLAACLKP
jgi:hypothetical protein